MSNSPIVYCGTGKHNYRGSQTRFSYPQLVQNKTTEDKHKQEYVKPSVSRGVGAEIFTVPPQNTLQLRLY